MIPSKLTEIFWRMDLTLVSVALLLSFSVLLYAVIKECRNIRRNAALLKIKKNIHGLAGVKTPPAYPGITINNTENFLDITMNRDTVLFSDEERTYIKKCFADAGNLDHIRRIAKTAHNKWRRIEAILSLGYAQDTSSLSILEGALFSKDDDVSYFAMVSLAGIKNRDSASILLAFLKMGGSSPHVILSILEKFGSDIDEDITLLASSEDPKTRQWAAKLIAARNMFYAASDVKKLLSDPSAEVRSAACDCIGRLKDTTAKNELKERLGDNAWFIRMNAVRALSRTFGKDAIPDIVPLIFDPTLFVKESVKSAITKDIEAAIPYIGRILEEGDPLTKQEVIEALEASGYLKKILDDIAYKSGKDHAAASELLEKMLKASVRFGVGSAAERYNPEGRAKILVAIQKINPDLAGKIEDNWKKRGITND